MGEIARAVLEQHNEAKSENDEQSEPKKPAQKRHEKDYPLRMLRSIAVVRTRAAIRMRRAGVSTAQRADTRTVLNGAAERGRTRVARAAPLSGDFARSSAICGKCRR